CVHSTITHYDTAAGRRLQSDLPLSYARSLARDVYWLAHVYLRRGDAAIVVARAFDVNLAARGDGARRGGLTTLRILRTRCRVNGDDRAARRFGSDRVPAD